MPDGGLVDAPSDGQRGVSRETGRPREGGQNGRVVMVAFHASRRPRVSSRIHDTLCALCNGHGMIQGSEKPDRCTNRCWTTTMIHVPTNQSLSTSPRAFLFAASYIWFLSERLRSTAWGTPWSTLSCRATCSASDQCVNSLYQYAIFATHHPGIAR